ncbi:unnamed protein product [Calicophoron daubneyi]|uniref:Uncharacterized protein n=1 Tax=Calicophoron daubneyi TaxID=300641 RepID=A0AAV2TYF5_CALDB
MGNRQSQASHSVNTRRHTFHITRAGDFENSNAKSADIQRYLQPPSATLNEYLEAQKIGSSNSLEALPYCQAYEHFCDLAGRNLQSSRSTDLLGTPDQSLGSSTNSRTPSQQTRKKSRWFRRGDSASSSKKRKPFHDYSTAVTCSSSAVGDVAPPGYDEDESGSESDDVAIRVDLERPPVKMLYQSHVSGCEENEDTRITNAPSIKPDSKANRSRSRSGYGLDDSGVESISDVSSKSMALSQKISRSVKDHIENTEYVDDISTRTHSLRNGDRGDVMTFAGTNRSEENSKKPVVSRFHQLGFQTEPDGTIIYTAYLRAGSFGVPTEGFLTDIRKRAARHLAGLYRQYHCTVRFEPELIPYRGSYVHPVLITGQNHSDLIRCRNALPACIEKYLITSRARHNSPIRAR